MPSYDKTVEFYLTDHPRTLFPLETNRFLVENYASKLGGFVYERITHKKDCEISSLPQTRAYAAKPHFHLRRTPARNHSTSKTGVSDWQNSGRSI